MRISQNFLTRNGFRRFVLGYEIALDGKDLPHSRKYLRYDEFFSVEKDQRSTITYQTKLTLFNFSSYTEWDNPTEDLILEILNNPKI